MKTKLMAILFATACLMTGLVGCSSKNAETPAENVSGTSDESQAADSGSVSTLDSSDTGTAGSTSAEGGDLTVWIVALFNEEANTSLAEQLKSFEGADVTVEQIAAAEMPTQLATALQSGTMPDICIVHAGMLLSISESIPFLDLTDLYEEIEADRPFVGSLRSVSTFGEKLPLIPLYESAIGLFCRKDVFTAAGLGEADIPSTWEEYVDVAYKLDGAVDGVYSAGTGFGASDDDDEANFLWCWYFANGGKLWNEDGSISEDEKDVKLMEDLIGTYAKMYEDGLIPPDASTWDGGGNNASYLNGTTAMVMNSFTLYNAMTDSEDYAELLENTWVAPVPAGTDGTVNQAGIMSFAVSESSKNPDGAKALIKYMMTGDWYDGWIEQLFPLNAPVFADFGEKEKYADGVGKTAFEFIQSNKTVYTGYGVTDPAVLTAGSQFSLTFPICNALQSVIVGGESAQNAAAGLFEDAKGYALN